MNNYENRTVDGADYFGYSQPVQLPRMNDIRRREGVIQAGEIHEIDVVGEYKLYNEREQCRIGFLARFCALSTRAHAVIDWLGSQAVRFRFLHTDPNILGATRRVHGDDGRRRTVS
ncbi:MAG: hypothetical protein AAF702_18350 [Chloroflexota bacterium]